MPDAPRNLVGLLKGDPHRAAPFTARESLFCRALANGSTQVDAHELAGYERNTGNASALAHRPDIQAEVHRLIALKDELKQFNADWWRERYLKLWNELENDAEGSYDSKLRALDIGAKVLGLYETHSDRESAENSAKLLALLAGLATRSLASRAKVAELPTNTVEGQVRILRGETESNGANGAEGET